MTSHIRRRLAAAVLVSMTTLVAASVPAAVEAQDATPVPAPPVSPKQYLDNANHILTGIADASLPSDARKTFAQLRTDFAALESAYAASQPPLKSAQNAGTPGGGNDEQAPDWKIPFYEVERDLALLIGGGSMLAAGTGNSVVRQQEVPDISLVGQKDPNVAMLTSLEALRTQIELFHDAATRAASVGH